MTLATKILVVEDEVLVGMDLVMLLEDWGYRADGPHASVDEALRAVEDFDPDLVILDMNLGGGATSLPVAEALQARKTPYIFLTGYTRLDASGAPLNDSAPILKKPVSEDQLKSLLSELSSRASTA